MKNYYDYIRLLEARKTGFNYEEVKGKLEIYAEGANGSYVTKIVSELKNVDDELKKLTEIKSDLLPKVKTYIKDVIDTEDEIKAIVLRSAKASIELAKSSVSKPKTDYESIFKEMIKLVSGELLDKLNELEKVYTKASEIQDFESKRTGKITVTEGIVETFINRIKKIADKFKTFISNFNTKLDDIEQKIKQVKHK